jgi:flagellar basal-body rod protein FlgG
LIRALYSAASGMHAQQTNVDNIAHNLANANTVGFKMRRAQFQDLLYQNVIQPGASANAQTRVPTGLQVGLGTRVVSNQILLNQGNQTMTSNPYDLLIEGSGFFAIRQSNGQIAFTRAGNFHLDRDGNMVTADGHLLDPPIVIPSDARNVYIAPDGVVTYSMPGQSNSIQAGQILIATFQNPAGLNNLGKNLLIPTDASGEPVFGQPGGAEGAGTLLQGYLEQSNVSLVEEFIGLISSQRAYEANAKVVRAADEMYQQLNNLGR